MIDWLEKLHNQASDTNFVWFPFQRLKPRPEQWMGFGLRLKMTVLFGAYFGIFYCLRRTLGGNRFDWKLLEQSVLRSMFVFFVWFNLVTAFFWNRRVRRIRQLRQIRLERVSFP
jgi:hypothetical protein